MSTLDDKQREIDDLKTKFFSSNDLYSQYLGGENEIPTLVKNKVMAGYDNNKDTIEEENRLQEEMNTNRVSDKFSAETFAGDPFAAGKAYVQRQAAIERRVQDIRGIRTERTGTLNDIMQSVLGAYQAKTTRMGAEADASKTKYSIAQDEYDRMYKEEQDKKAEALAWYNAKKGGGGGNTAESQFSNLNAILGQLGGIFNQGDKSADFTDGDTTLTREKMASKVQEGLGLSYQDSLSLIYNNFKSKEEITKGQITDNKLNSDIMSRLGKTPSASVNLSKKSTAITETQKLMEAFGL